jgi:prephenate dehydratase
LNIHQLVASPLSKNTPRSEVVPMRTAYLGPSGSFTEAALGCFGVPAVHAVPYANIEQALEAARTGAADTAVVPLENSVEGVVTTSVDTLAHSPELRITGEVLLRVDFALAVPAGGLLDGVRRVLTHPHAHAQCRAWLAEHLPRAEFVPVSSTAQAALSVARCDAIGTAAVAAPATALRYGLDVLARGIGARADAVTRFVRVGAGVTTPPPTGADRTTLIVPLADRVRELPRILKEFTDSTIPLTAVLSRPTGDGLGRYSFFLECEGHIAQRPVRDALAALRRLSSGTVFLGSYPRAQLPHPAEAGVPFRPARSVTHCVVTQSLSEVVSR